MEPEPDSLQTRIDRLDSHIAKLEQVKPKPPADVPRRRKPSPFTTVRFILQVFLFGSASFIAGDLMTIIFDSDKPIDVWIDGEYQLYQLENTAGDKSVLLKVRPSQVSASFHRSPRNEGWRGLPLHVMVLVLSWVETSDASAALLPAPDSTRTPKR